MSIVHVLLLKRFDTRVEDAPLLAEIDACRGRIGEDVAVIGPHRGLRSADVYVYFLPALAREQSDPAVASLRAVLQECCTSAGEIGRVDRLQCVLDVPGASREAVSGFHYVVETDAAPGAEDELARWYDTEHMPGLASVAGCVRARRFLNRDGGPLSYACYDLVAPEILESPTWLAVRKTPWSDRVRPQFRNTRRAMFRSVMARNAAGPSVRGQPSAAGTAPTRPRGA